MGLTEGASSSTCIQASPPSDVEKHEPVSWSDRWHVLMCVGVMYEKGEECCHHNNLDRLVRHLPAAVGTTGGSVTSNIVVRACPLGIRRRGLGLGLGLGRHVEVEVQHHDRRRRLPVARHMPAKRLPRREHTGADWCSFSCVVPLDDAPSLGAAAAGGFRCLVLCPSSAW
jgi:hypothetical protein